ncbi:MAG: hypothetical protein ACHQ2F_02730 [Desulfobaccales bacterium]
MSFLESLEKRNSPPFDQFSIDQLPPAIKEKACLIARHIDVALLFMTGEESSLENIKKEIMDPLEDIADLFRPSAGDRVSNFDFELLKFKFLIDAQDEALADIYKKDKELFFSILEKNRSIKRKADNDNDLAFFEYIKPMVKPDYEPDKDLWNIITMLQTLLCYWVEWPHSRLLIAGADLILNNQLIKDNFLQRIAEALREIETKEAFLDLSLTKIAYRLGLEVNDIHEWGRRDKIRTRGSTETKVKKMDNDTKIILEAIKLLNIPKEAKRHSVAVKVHEHLKETLKEPPSIRTIERRLKEKAIL